MDLIEQLRAQSSDAQTKASESNLSGDIQTLLKTVVFNKASDLHLVSRSEPQIRIDGTLRPLEFGVLSGKDIENLCYALITDAQKSELENQLDKEIQESEDEIQKIKKESISK